MFHPSWSVGASERMQLCSLTPHQGYSWTHASVQNEEKQFSNILRLRMLRQPQTRIRLKKVLNRPFLTPDVERDSSFSSRFVFCKVYNCVLSRKFSVFSRETFNEDPLQHTHQSEGGVVHRTRTCWAIFVKFHSNQENLENTTQKCIKFENEKKVQLSFLLVLPSLV